MGHNIPGIYPGGPKAIMRTGAFPINAPMNLTNDFTKPLALNSSAYANDEGTMRGTIYGDPLSGKYGTEALDDHRLSSPEVRNGTPSIDGIVDRLNRTLHIQNGSDTVSSIYRNMATNYNRFKVALPNSVLRAGYAHLFFIKPNCNIWDLRGGTSTAKTNFAANSHLENSPLFSYAKSSDTTRAMLDELTVTNESHQFMFSLSNAAISFSPQDEYIQDDTYGRGYTGYKIAYGKSNIESRTAGSFDIEYQDDRDMHIYQTHKLWEEYISGVYRGIYMPRVEDIKNKVLDYCGALYYIVTAEDGESIIFWSKYYGVFPTTAPSAQLAWASGNALDGTSTRFTITYKYSFKVDYDPYCIGEFNMNSIPYYQSQRDDVSTKPSYVPVYDKGLGHVGDTWVGQPFIEQHPIGNGSDIQYLLRFMAPSAYYEDQPVYY